jgi:hypothetical protein
MRSKRVIGPIGTSVRILLGIGAFVSAFFPHRPYGWQVVLGLVGLPAVFVAWQVLRARRNPGPAREPEVGVVVSIVLGVALLGPDPTRPVGLLFGAVSLLVAGIRGYGGCEITAIGNWLLRRDDQVGCVVLSPVDVAERRIQAGGTVQRGVAP